MEPLQDMTTEDAVNGVIQIGKDFEQDYNTRMRDIGKEIPCPKSCGGVMWEIAPRIWKCGDCRCERKN